MFLDIARGTNRADVCHDYGRAVATLLQGLGSYPRVASLYWITHPPVTQTAHLSGAALQGVLCLLSSLCLNDAVHNQPRDKSAYTVPIHGTCCGSHSATNKTLNPS
jgi:hypothetical protein